MVDGAPSRSTCRHLSCLEVCKLLQCGSEVVYPEGLNGGFKPIWGSVWDAESTNEPTMLQVNLPRTTCRDVTTATSQWSSMPISSAHSVTVTRPSMEEEVERLLSCTLSTMPEQSCAPVSPRRPPPMVPNTPAASKGKAPLDFGKIIPVYPKQPPPPPKSHHKWVWLTLQLIPATSSPWPGTPERNSTPSPLESQANSITLPDDVLHLQEEMNNAKVHLLTLRASVGACWQGLISESDWNQSFQSHQWGTGLLHGGTLQYWGHLHSCHERGRGCPLSLH